ncbi:MAG: hypothetical protein CMO16_02990 [Thaumarchaeota archaeon]|nr:hypothetical protein [Nitrososphaerota archaeon]
MVVVIMFIGHYFERHRDQFGSYLMKRDRVLKQRVKGAGVKLGKALMWLCIMLAIIAFAWPIVIIAAGIFAAAFIPCIILSTGALILWCIATKLKKGAKDG